MFTARPLGPTLRGLKIELDFHLIGEGPALTSNLDFAADNLASESAVYFARGSTDFKNFSFAFYLRESLVIFF